MTHELAINTLRNALKDYVERHPCKEPLPNHCDCDTCAFEYALNLTNGIVLCGDSAFAFKFKGDLK